MPKGKKMSGSVRAKAGMPAKAGRRKPPTNSGPHVTTASARDRGRWLHNLGFPKDRKTKRKTLKQGE